MLFVYEALGGALLGLAGGYIAYRAMRAIDQHDVEVMISLALVTVTYSMAELLDLSGPIAVVIAGVLVGSHARQYAMSENTRRHIDMFWSVIDEVLNSLLFLLIGLEIVVVEGGLGNIYGCRRCRYFKLARALRQRRTAGADRHQAQGADRSYGSADMVGSARRHLDCAGAFAA